MYVVPPEGQMYPLYVYFKFSPLVLARRCQSSDTSCVEKIGKADEQELIVLEHHADERRTHASQTTKPPKSQVPYQINPDIDVVE